MPKKRWTAEKVIEELERTRQGGPKMNSQLDAAARRYFGSLRAALEIAGLPCGKRPPPYNQWSKESVIVAIRRRHHEGACLSRTNRDDRALYEAGKRLFGTWTAAREAAGFAEPPRNFYSADEVRLKIIELYDQELPLRFASHRDEKLSRSARKHFGGWRNAIRSLGLEDELPRQWNEHTVVEAICERRAAGHPLYQTCAEDKKLFRAGIKYFGSWEKALRAAGINETARQRWSEAKVIARLRELSAKFPGESIRRHDSNVAYAAEKRFGTLANALEVAGVSDNPKQRRAAS